MSFAANNQSSPWAWPDDARPQPVRQDAAAAAAATLQQLTLPPMQTLHDPSRDPDIHNAATTSAASPARPPRSTFLAHVLNRADDGAATQRIAPASSSRHHHDPRYTLPRPDPSPPLHFHPQMPSPQTARHHGYVDLTREQTPPISQERSTLRTLHDLHQPAAASPTATDSTSSPMPPHGRRKRDATSPLFVSQSPSPKRARRNDGGSNSGRGGGGGGGVGGGSSSSSGGGGNTTTTQPTGGRRGSRQEGGGGGGGGGSSNATAPRGSEAGEIERIDLLDDDTPLATALQKQRAEQVKAQQESQSGADAPTTLTNITCVICMDTPKDLTATACGHVFCHTCLMEALIAGEQRAGPGEPKRSQCPVCRKALSRTKTGDIIPLLLMKKALATQPRRQRGGGAAASAATASVTGSASA